MRSSATRLLRCRPVALAFLLFLPSAFGATAPSLSIALKPFGVEVTNASVSGDVVLFSETVSSATYYPVYCHVALAATADKAGAVIFSTKHAADPRGVWLAIDVNSGDVAIATPSGGVPAAIVLPDSARGKDASGQIVKLQLPFDIADLLLVRPGEGAWHVTAIDGGPKDEDHTQNGETSMAFDTLSEVKKNGKPPHALKRGDVIVAVEARTFRYTIIRVKE